MTKKAYRVTIFFLSLMVIGGWLWISPAKPVTAPAVTFKTIDGRQINLQELRGQAVLVTFWATTCPTCVKEIPHLVSLYEDLSVHGLEVIGVAMSYDPPNQVIDLANRHRLPYPISLDVDGSIASAFNNVIFTPTSFLIAPDGSIVKHSTGKMDIAELEQQIRNLLFRQSQITDSKSQESNNKTGI